ncbi:MAG: hypothetical protein J6J24_02580 [Clostridia bacterium]|nr:hypothetical protein [Clostridia bacterium]
MGIETTVAGFVLTNNASIANSRVGGESFKHIVEIVGQTYVRSDDLENFTIEAQGDIAGFVGTNDGEGNISACFVDCLQIYNNLQSNTSISAGFVLYNNNSIQGSYVEAAGKIEPQKLKGDVYRKDTNITSIGIVAGFVYTNQSHIKNSYANIAIENENSKSSMVAGFVYKNEASGLIELCFAACAMTKNDINQMEFSGVDDFANSLNKGKISLSYYFSTTAEATNQTRLTSGALIVTEIYGNEKDFYGFSFSSGEDAYDGIWKMTDEGITLVSANKIALSNRYAVTSDLTKLTSVFYNKNILDVDEMRYIDLSYGSENNPIIIRNAYDFAVATGRATSKEISSYKEYYSDTEVFGHYRLVDDLDMAEIDQNEENDGGARLTTTEKLMKGVLDGNGFTITNINLGSNEEADNFGLFATMDNAVVMNLNLIVDSIHNSQALVVGGLAGTAVDSRIIAINLTPLETDSNNGHTSIQGKNIVGGVVGMLFGNSKLNDISIQDIEIYSAYYDENKNVNTNKGRTGQDLRSKVETNSSLKNYVKELSYAGAVVGYADIYNPIDIYDEPIAFDASLDVVDYHLITIKVTNSVNIYGEVAGGLFGYVGDSTLVYDASITLNADGAKTTPSYIIAKNLYSGGIVGENHGGLFAVSASYSDEIEEQIQTSENAYYNGNSGVERGQQSIFSYEEDDAGFVSNKNEPMFIGGIAGYMSGGYIYIGYNKLNVISHSNKTLAVGGVVGFAGYNDYLYELSRAANATMVNMYFTEVYSAGDLCVDGVSEVAGQKNVSGGIIGAVEKNIDNYAVIALQNAMSVNYYGYNSYGLLGDVEPVVTATSYVSDRHFMLIGSVVDSMTMKNVDDFKGNLFLLNTENNVVNLSKSSVAVALNNPTVGGYYKVALGSSGTSYGIKTFGMKIESFDSEDMNIGGNASSSLNILYAENVGEDSMSTPSASYAKMYNYFLAKGWTYAYWLHEENTLFPEIQLTPKVDVVFWDCFNTIEVLESMQDSGVTVVVRGKVDNDPASDIYSDIDLRLSEKNPLYLSNKTNMEDLLPVKEFSGTLISYYHYMGTDDMGKVSEGREKKDGTKLIGGSFAENVGLIMSESLFEDLGKGVSIIGLNLYFVSDGGAGGAAAAATGIAAHATATAGAPKLVKGKTEMAILRDLNFVYNDSFTIDGGVDIGLPDGETVSAMGLITDVAYSTSFVNISITTRVPDEHTVKTIKFDPSSRNRKQIYMGVLAGYIAQQDSATQVSIDTVKFITQDMSKVGIAATQKKNGASIEFGVGAGGAGEREDTYIGLYAGMIEKSVDSLGSRGKISVGLTNLQNVDVKVYSAGPNKANLTIGGFVGKASGVDKVSIVNEEEPAVSGKGLNIIQNTSTKNMVAGLGFGEILGGDVFELIGSEGVLLKLKGKIYQDGSKADNAQIGGLAGKISTQARLTNVALDFSVGGKEANADVYGESLYNYTNAISGYEAVKTFKVVGGVGADDAVGGIFGYTTASVDLLDNVAISGSLEVEVEHEDGQLAVGGMIGKTINSLTIKTKSANNDMNIAVVGKTAYVGGVLGWAKNTGSSTVASQRIDINSVPLTASESEILPTERMTYSGTVLASVQDFSFGGAIGYSDRVLLGELDEASVIKNYVNTGAVKLFWGSKDPTNITVGGVVGTLDGSAAANGEFNIDRCLSYGDVFVNYASNENKKLSTYTFGGILGAGYVSADTVKVLRCYSLMTSFNEKMVNTDYIANYNANAIVGKNATSTMFEAGKENYYNSGLSMVYQNEKYNVDAYYVAPVDEKNYNGYIVNENTSAEKESILERLATVFSSDDYELGHKLNPVLWGTSSGSLTFNYELKQFTELGVKYYKVVDSAGTAFAGYEKIKSLNGITWVSMQRDVETNTAIADTFSNIAFVGNGHTISVKSADEKDVSGGADYYGGLVNVFGTSATTSADFNVISGLVVDLDIVLDLNRASASSDNFGGVAGKMAGHSILYGVGVNGSVSVGGKNQALWIGGLVGELYTGKIEYCYQDSDITYRGSDYGVMSGIANLADKNTLISATYASGLLETYSKNKIYTLAFGNKGTSNFSRNYIIDCYSVSQIKRNSVTGDNFFVNTNSSATEGVTVPIVYLNQPLCGTHGVTLPAGLGSAVIDDIAIPYGGNVNDGLDIWVTWNSMYAPANSHSVDPEDEKLSDGATPKALSNSNWRFSRYLNYGYASHNFGYLTNITTYTQESCWVDENGEKTENSIDAVKYPDGSYKTKLLYTKLTYAEIEDKGTSGDASWYLGVPNTYKFEQMLDTVDYDDSNVYKAYYGVIPRKYKLRYGFEISDTTINKLGKTVGDSSRKFALDGDGNTLDAADKSWTTPMFGTINGDVSNINIYNAKIGSEGSFGSAGGVLANSVTGKLINVGVSGEIYSGNAQVGGIVGTLKSFGAADIFSADLDSTVNIVSNEEAASVGGIAGALSGKLMLSINAGQLIAEGKGANIGGIVGRIIDGAVSSRILSSYNVNAVVNNYTTTTGNNGTISAGGIVGKIEKETYLTYCYNAGLVGAGNYAFAGQAYSGGIFGYAGEKITLNTCMNEGAVEAISKPFDAKTTLVRTTKSGDEDITSWNNSTNDSINYKAEIKIQYGTVDRVNAYGMGYGTGAIMIDNCKSTTNNIKNDGEIAVPEETKELIVNRKDVFNNDGNYWAKFDLNTDNMFCNGYDSYGNPMRIYMVDKMTRSYGNPDDWTTNPIAKNLNSIGTAPGTFSWDVEDFSYLGIFDANRRPIEANDHGPVTFEYVTPEWSFDWTHSITRTRKSYYSGVWQNKNKEHPGYRTKVNAKGQPEGDFYDLTSSEVKWSTGLNTGSTGYCMPYSGVGYGTSMWEFNFIGDGYYYSAIEFKGLDKWIEEKRPFGNLTNKTGAEAHYNASISESVNEKMDEINELKKSVKEMEKITVNGQTLGIVYNGSQLNAGIAPYSAEITKTFTMQSVAEAESLTKNNFKVEGSGIVYYEITDVTTSGKNVAVKAKLAGSSSGSKSYTIRVVKEDEGSELLKKNNVSRETGKVTLTLQDNDVGGILDSSIVTAIRSASEDYKLFVKIGSSDEFQVVHNATNLALSWSSDKAQLAIKEAGVSADVWAELQTNLDGKVVNLRLESTINSTEPADVEMTTTEQVSASVTLTGKASSYNTYTSATKTIMDLYTNDRYATETVVNLATTGIANDYILGKEGEFRIYYKDSIAEYSLGVDGVDYADLSVGDVELSIDVDQKLHIKGTETAVNDFLQLELDLLISGYVTTPPVSATENFTLGGLTGVVEYSDAGYSLSDIRFGNSGFATETKTFKDGQLTLKSSSQDLAVVRHVSAGGTITEYIKFLASSATTGGTSIDLSISNVNSGDKLQMLEFDTEYNPTEAEGKLIVDPTSNAVVMTVIDNSGTELGKLTATDIGGKIITKFAHNSDDSKNYRVSYGVEIDDNMFAIVEEISASGVKFALSPNGYKYIAQYEKETKVVDGTATKMEQIDLFEKTTGQNYFSNSSTVGGMEVSNFKYWIDGDAGASPVPATIYPTRYGNSTLTYTRNVGKSLSGTVSLATSPSAGISVILLAEDIRMSGGSTKDNVLEIRGQGHYISYFGNAENSYLFGMNKSKLVDLDIVASVDMIISVPSKDYGFILKKNDTAGTLENVRMLGNMRNVNIDTSSVEAGIGGNSGNIIDCSSNIVVTGSKARGRSAVSVKLKDTFTATGLTKKNILIAGNGVNGANHYEGRTDGASKDGTNGGSVEVFASYTGYARAGTSGVAGYGKNGENFPGKPGEAAGANADIASGTENMNTKSVDASLKNDGDTGKGLRGISACGKVAMKEESRGASQGSGTWKRYLFGGFADNATRLALSWNGDYPSEFKTYPTSLDIDDDFDLYKYAHWINSIELLMKDSTYLHKKSYVVIQVKEANGWHWTPYFAQESVMVVWTDESGINIPYGGVGGHTPGIGNAI